MNCLCVKLTGMEESIEGLDFVLQLSWHFFEKDGIGLQLSYIMANYNRNSKNTSIQIIFWAQQSF